MMKLYLVDYCTAMGILDQDGDIILAKANKEPSFDQVARAIESPCTGSVYVEGLTEVFEKDLRDMSIDHTVEINN